MNYRILEPAVQQFLNNHLKQDPHQIALSRSPFENINASELAAQVDSRQRCRLKLPTWFAAEGIYYPRRLSVEQSSSEAAAAYKASLIPEGAKLLDMTGGLGVDSYFFSNRASEVHYVERDQELIKIAQHNDRVLRNGPRRGIIDFMQGDSTGYLLAAPADMYDLIYIDPSRRVSGGKVFRLRDCEPDVVALQDSLLEKSRFVLIKAAPMLDIDAARSEIHSIRQIHVVSVAGECKELLLLIDRNFDGPTQIVIVTTDRQDIGMHQRLTFNIRDEQKTEPIFGDPLQFLYEPDAALLKAGAFKYTARYYGIAKLAQHTHLYTSDRLVADFMGKISTVEDVIPYSVFKKRKQHTPGNIITKNFPVRADTLRRRHQIKDAQENNLYFCRNRNQELIVIQSRTIRVPNR